MNIRTFYEDLETRPIEEIKEFVKRDTRSVFGYNFLGYLYLCIGENKKAIEALETAIQLNPDNGYAYCKLSRAYGQLYLKSAAMNPLKKHYQDKSLEMYQKARSTSSIYKRRLGWLRKWLKHEGILEKTNVKQEV